MTHARERPRDKTECITSLSVRIETKRAHLGAVVFQFMGSIQNCTKDDIHKSSLLDLPNKLLTTIKHCLK